MSQAIIRTSIGIQYRGILNPGEQILITFSSKYNNFHSRNAFENVVSKMAVIHMEIEVNYMDEL